MDEKAPATPELRVRTQAFALGPDGTLVAELDRIAEVGIVSVRVELPKRPYAAGAPLMEFALTLGGEPLGFELSPARPQRPAGGIPSANAAGEPSGAIALWPGGALRAELGRASPALLRAHARESVRLVVTCLG